MSVEISIPASQHDQIVQYSSIEYHKAPEVVLDLRRHASSMACQDHCKQVCIPYPSPLAFEIRESRPLHVHVTRITSTH